MKGKKIECRTIDKILELFPEPESMTVSSENFGFELKNQVNNNILDDALDIIKLCSICKNPSKETVLDTYRKSNGIKLEKIVWNLENEIKIELTPAELKITIFAEKAYDYILGLVGLHYCTKIYVKKQE